VPEHARALVAGFNAVPEQLRELEEEHDRRSEELAHRFESTQDLIFLVRGINYPIALGVCCS
jgi:glucosamine--fructose-6-phosphate aminotransferase (isomerizing)